MNFSKCICILFFFLLGIIGVSQNSTPKIDSLKIELKTSIQTFEKAKNYGSIAWEYLNIDLEQTELYIDSSLALYESIKHKKGISNSYYRYGVLYRKMGDYDKAISSFKVIEAYAQMIKDTSTLADCAYQKGVIYGNKGDYQKSLEAYYQSLELYKLLQNIKSQALVLNSVGIVQKNLKNYPKAIEIYEEAVSIYKASNNLRGLSDTYGNLGNIYAIKNDFDKAIKYFERSLQVDKKLKNNWGIAINNMDMGKLYLKQNKYNQAIKLLEKALLIQTKYNFKKELTETLIGLGEANRLKQNYKKSSFYLDKALSQNMESKSINQSIYFQLFLLNQDQKNYIRALESYKIYTNLKDSIYQEKKIKSINDLQIKYESKVKDEEIASQKLGLNLKENLILKKQNQLRLALFGSIVFLISSIGIWMFYRQKQKLKNKEIEALNTQKELNKLEALIDGEENERKRIAQDLHDGINGDLSVIKYKITSIKQDKFIQKEKEEFNMAIDMLDTAIEQVRRISQNLVPPSLQNFNLIEALKQFTYKISTTNTKTKINFQYYGEYLKLNKEVETAIYRIIQELITNITKHSQATEALLQINNHEKNMHITVEDNGIGFSTSKGFKGLGLKNIESRVAFLNADFLIDTNPNGTTITIDINTNNLKDD